MKRLSLASLAAFACACAATGLSPAGSKVVPVTAQPSAQCQTLGQVIGHGGGFWTGGMTTNENLAISAVHDANNKAAEMGATHLQTNPPQFAASGQGTTTSATVTGVAYKCPPGSGAPADSAVTGGVPK
jgi:hypothetical protein